MAGAARAVRIPRARELPTTPGGAPTPSVETAPSAAPSHRFTNKAGNSRALRTFLFFLVALAVIYGVFMDIAVTSVVGGANGLVEGVLTAAVAVALLIGWVVTLGQSPSVAWVEDGHLVVRNAIGRTRRFPTDAVRIHVLRSNGVGLLGPEPTEFVEVSLPGGVRRTYLVATHFFDFAH